MAIKTSVNSCYRFRTWERAKSLVKNKSGSSVSGFRSSIAAAQNETAVGFSDLANAIVTETLALPSFSVIFGESGGESVSIACKYRESREADDAATPVKRFSPNTFQLWGKE